MRKGTGNSSGMVAISDATGFMSEFAVSRETADRLTIYAELLAKWQKTINLVAPSTLGAVWSRHFADSAQILPLARNATGYWVDLGSGAGFPGLVLAILRAEMGPMRATLVESDSRKCAFLAEVLRKVGLPPSATVEIRNQRIENPATQDSLTGVDVITARALAPLDRLFELSAGLFAPSTRAFFLKGRDTEAEIEAARLRWSFVCEIHPSRTDPSGRIVEVRGPVVRMEGLGRG